MRLFMLIIYFSSLALADSQLNLNLSTLH